MAQSSAIAVLSALFAGALYGLGAFYIAYQRRFSSNPARLGILYLSLSLVWSAAVALERSGVLELAGNGPLLEVRFAGIVFLAAVLFFLTRAVMGVRGEWWGWAVFGLAWMTFAVILKLGGWLLITLLPLGESWRTGLDLITKVVVLAGWAVFIFGAAQITLKTYRQYPPLSTHAAYWLAPLLLTMIGDSLLIVGYPSVGDLVRVSGGLAAAAVISAPRLPDLDDRLRRRLDAGIYGAFSGFLYLLIAALGLEAARRWPQVGVIWMGLLAAAAIVLVINPLLAGIWRRFQERPSGSPDALADLLRQYSQSITNMLDLNLLATVAVGTASEYLEIRRGFLFLVEPLTDASDQKLVILHGAKGMGDINPTDGRFEADSALAAYFNSASDPITHGALCALPGFQEPEPAWMEWLSGLGAEAYIPIYSKEEWIGLMALGPKNSGQAYTASDLAFLSTLAGQTAVALENARLVEGLVRLNEESRRAYQALDQANRHLERLDKSKSDFLTIVTHELRTPLTLISGAGQLLFDEPELEENPYYEKLLANLKNGIQRLDQIVESMLDMARIDTRLVELELQPVYIHRLMQMVYEDLKNDARQRKQTIELNELESLPTVMADLPGLRKVFYNILINAIKFTPDGGKILIWGQKVPPDGADLPAGGVEVIISDTGIGIDPDYRDLVFIKFYQTGDVSQHSSGKSKFKGGGPGLGLSIARGIVEAHQGKIWVESQGYDEKNYPGSQFHVVLPLRPGEKPVLHV